MDYYQKVYGKRISEINEIVIAMQIGQNKY